MKTFYPFLTLLLAGFTSFAQLSSYNNNTQSPSELKPLSIEEEADLKAIPALKLPAAYKFRSLPAIVDNSTQPYMRQAFQQAGLCCGQAAGIGYNYTYEIDRSRNIPANANDNLYPTHWTWNWMHGGNGYYGVSFLHSFQILKHCGNVNVTDYGGSLSYGGAERWMSGYNDYYRGMANRINSIHQIQVGTPEGLEIFKNWINDHLDGSGVGGVGSFYSQYMSASNTLPAGTPEAGKYVLTTFGGSANHAQTIVGYNDSIRWDYNNDGQYTNDIDINNDGFVDMKDWEIGGFKMVQSYGGVPGWGDQGFAYMMYKTVADDIGQGGIWNHCVYVLNVKENCDPQATMKVSLTHNARNMIKVVAGLSNNVNAIAPDFILEFPIFNYQGGIQYMQGGNSIPANKTIEFGLDISPLLGETALNQDVKFFLQVYEYDPNGLATGQINSFSVIDYTNGVSEIVCPQTNVPIANHDMTSMSLVANFNFNRVNITNSMLPPATVGQPYSHQLTAAGGHPPYSFKLVKKYQETVSTESFAMINQQQLYPGNSGNGKVSKTLDFDFPYYDSVYSSVSVHVDGYLMFDEQLFPYPYFIDDMVQFRVSRHISPFMCHAIRLYSSDNDGIWYEGDANSATFRWKASIDGISGSTDINFAVKLYPSGDMEFFYGDISIPDDKLWISGLCDGNEDDMQFSSFYFDNLPAPNTKYEYARYNYPEGLEVSDDGLISGTVQQAVNGEVMNFKVTDNNFVYDHKTLMFSTTGVTITDSISSGGDEIMEYGEIVNHSVTLTNLEGYPISDASISIVINDPYITMMDNSQYIGNLGVGQTIELVNAFSYMIEPDIPNEHLLEIETSIEGTTKQVWENTLTHLAYAPVLQIIETTIDDGNNARLDPGETCDISLRLQNSGGSKASLLACMLESSDPYISINLDSVFVSLLDSDSSALLIYNLSVAPDAPIGHLAAFDLMLSGAKEFELTIEFELRVGLTIEDFETGGFHQFTWGFSGNRDWIIDGQYPYEGSFGARSGYISHAEQSSMILDIEVLTPGDISFFRKVSCENHAYDNYDFLSFYIDGAETARWDSILGWEEVSFPVGTGYHRFEWRYTKDSTVSAGLDAAFIDYISLPGCLDAMPHLLAMPAAFDKGMHPNSIDTDTLFISNPGFGEIEFGILITSTTDNTKGPESIAGSYLECDQTEFFAGEDFDWSFNLFNGSDDNEWIQHLTIQLPQGIHIEECSNFIGGSGGDLNFEGNFGNGPLMSWYGEDASGWGVVHGGEYAHANLSGYVESGFSGDATLEYVITGDIYGSDPHVLEGQISLTNLGGNVPWISCDSYAGTVAGMDEDQIMVTFNTNGLNDGHYYCNIILRDNFQHEAIIPVHLLVDTYLDISDNNDSEATLEVFPNPFIDQTNIILNSPSNEKISIKVVDIDGRTRALIADGIYIPAGEHNFIWQTGNGDNIGNGMYFIVVEYGNTKMIRKVIRHE